LSKATEPADSLVLRVARLSKRFGPVKALDEVDLAVRAGTVHALVGLNGSGKSTLIKCLSGYYKPDAGTIEVHGVAVTATATAAARQDLGLSFMHQDLGLVDGMPILDNVRTGRYGTRFGKIRWRAERAYVERELRRFGVRRDVDDLVETCAPWERAVVGLIRALQAVEATGGAGLIVLDEPTVSLPEHEVELLFEAVREVAAAGSGVLFVSHRSDEVLALSDEVSVIRDGRITGNQRTATLDSQSLVNLIVGRELGQLYPGAHSSAGEEVLSVKGLTGPTIRDASFGVAAGEIVGLAGIAGAGHNEVPHLLVGSVAPSRGSIVLGGKTLDRPSPRKAQARGMVLVPADRAGRSALSGASTRENLTATSIGRYRRLPLRSIDVKQERARAAALVDAFHVVPRDPEQAFTGLSGGNQQKVILARVLENQPRVVLLEEPTQGVDVGAKKRVFEIIRSLADGGTAVLYASTEYEDLAHLCDRVIIFRGGELYGELVGDQLSKERILEQCYAG
jgi:ribose transport system ATP-binding protein